MIRERCAITCLHEDNGSSQSKFGSTTRILVTEVGEAQSLKNKAKGDKCKTKSMMTRDLRVSIYLIKR